MEYNQLIEKAGFYAASQILHPSTLLVLSL
jgi:hypothetical protein